MSEKLKVNGLESPKFCDTCGSFMKRDGNGVWICGNKHTQSDAITESIQRNRAEKTKAMIDANAKLLASLLKGTKDAYVFQLINPFREKQKDGLKNNPSSFKVYEELHDLEKKYPSTKFRYLRGDIFGTKETKMGHILCSQDIVADVKIDIEKIKLHEKGQPEGHYILNQYESLDKIPADVLTKIENLFDSNKID